MADQPQSVAYRPAGPTCKAFHESDAFVRAIRGPIGSAKSTTCAVELLRRSMMQTPGPDGVRRTRWAIIRNTFPELRSTTIKTWSEWCPTHYGKFTLDSPIVHHLKEPGYDAEFLFLALDKAEDVSKLLSLELTGAWVNEAREIPKQIIDALTGRVGRYPNARQGGCTWSGILMDTNPPDNEHWWYRLSEIETPKGWQFFRQPSGMSDEAENLNYLNQTTATLKLPLGDPKRLAQGRGYYQRIMGGKDPDWVKVYVHGEYGFVTEGAAVYANYRDQVHCASEPLKPVEDLPIMIGVDFGLTPAAIIGQRLTDGRWIILDELVANDVGVVRLAELLVPYLAQKFPANRVDGAWGDPAGSARSQTDERTALEIMTTYTGFRWRPAPSNDLTMRLEVVKNALNRMIDGRPGLLVSPRCRVLRKGFAGGYCRKFVKASGGTQVHEQPAKNAYSHPHDALQYLLLGGGEHNVVLHRVRRRRRSGPRIAGGLDYPLFG
ncbi:MAG: hypothetical protein D6754_04165 [Alphaproteobacteria bacterium]|nr:MAG: hypothetical protein D6754_04165 [Alphaproteobacteria bacterium]